MGRRCPMTGGWTKRAARTRIPPDHNRGDLLGFESSVLGVTSDRERHRRPALASLLF
jgi:hypothetical protein